MRIVGEDAGNMFAYIYRDDAAKGNKEVEWEYFRYLEEEYVLAEILDEAEKWNCKVYIISPDGEIEKLR